MSTKNALISAFETVTTTENGAKAYTTTDNSVLDLFFNLGVLQNKTVMNSNLERIMKLFSAALKENPTETIATMLYARAIRDGGIGQRFYFIEVMKGILSYGKLDAAAVDLLVTAINKGWSYWDDFFTLFDYALQHKLPVRTLFADVTKAELSKEPMDNLFAKWYPRKGRVWQYMRNTFDSPKALRKRLTAVKTVESLLGSKSFQEIIYAQVPSKSFKRNAKTFAKFDGTRYSAFLNKAVKGETTVKAAAIYPHEILFANNTLQVKTAQWINLPNMVLEDKAFLPILDCSGSMSGLPIQIAHSLGIYLSERNKSVFKDKVLTFSRNAHWVPLSGSLDDKVRTLYANSEIANTDFAQVFRLILKTALDNNVPQEDMPTHLICLTDGQFDMMSSGNSETHFVKFQKEFEAHGYKLPHIVFWNLRVTGNFPEKARTGVTMVGGSSPNAFKQALKGLDTLGVMRESIKPFMETAEKFVETID